MSYFPNIPVPPANSAANVYQSDVVGNKSDDENGTSITSHVYKTDHHDHSVAMVYPSMAAGVNLTKDATPWTLGAFAVIVPAGAITGEFDIHGLNFDDVPNAGTYEIVLYAGPDGGEVEVGRTRFTRQGSNTTTLEVPFQTVINAAGTQIKAKLAGGNSNASNCPVSIRYHLY